jgi:hypothetical protein
MRSRPISTDTACTWRARWALAERTLARAVAASPFNALAALRLANLRERSAAVATSPWATAYTRSLALRGYLDVGLLWPTLVEARYRCAVTAAALATTYERLAPNQRAAIRRLLPLAGPDDEFAQRLQRLAARESSATVQLLKPWYTLVREQRLRNQFESKGHERRALRHTVAISRHCVRMRKNATGGGGAWIVARFDDAIVHAVHMSVGKAYITWQGRYNAASFDALQLRRKGMRRRRRKRVERRALRNLDGAIREAAGELTRTWVHHDPDLVYFRERTTQPAEDEANSAATELQHARAPMRATWEEIVARAPDPATQHEPGREVPVPADVPRPTRAGSLRLPDRPWGDPQLRRIAWSLGLGIVVLAILSLAWLADADPVLLLVVGLVAGLPVVRRLVTAWVERQMADWSEPPADEAALPN